MLYAILTVGIGLIIALGSIILLDRNRFDHSPRATYMMSCALGLALVAAPALGIF